jgi:prepilin-type N-terminal cleavage/methylation domain-containing protein
MRGFTANVARSSPGFTLTELLVVISIIGLLAGLSAVAIPRAMEAGKRAKAKGDLLALVAAVKAYHQEYGVYPLKPSQRVITATEYFSWVGPSSAKGKPSKECTDFIKVLSGENLILEGVEMNPKQTRFLEGADREGNFLDPWGIAYSVKMDTNESGGVEYYDLSSVNESTLVRVIGISYGPDQTQSDPNLKFTPTFDDIWSWTDIPKK